METLISPAFPVLDAVLNNPLPEPENEAVRWPSAPDFPASASTARAAVDPSTTCQVKLFTFSEMLPALPRPKCHTDIFPLSPIVKVGVDTVI